MSLGRRRTSDKRNAE